MRKAAIAKMDTQTLVDHYVIISIDQNRAIETFDTRRYNRLFDTMVRIAHELKSRDGDQRRLLVPLLSHENVQVRLNAAKETLALAPNEALATIHDIASRRRYFYSGDAGMCLVALEKGIFIPS